MSSRHTNTIKLMWSRKGYQPNGYNWTNYNPTLSTFVIRHDLFEHQPNESGTQEEELRALGANFRFREGNEVFESVFYSTLRNVYGVLLKEKSINFLADRNCLNKELADLSFQAVGDHYLYFAQKLTDGYNYAKKFSQKSYDRMLLNYYEDFHIAGQNVTIDLDTGKICKITNSVAYVACKKELEQHIRIEKLRDENFKSEKTQLILSKSTATKIEDKIALENYLKDGGI